MLVRLTKAAVVHTSRGMVMRGPKLVALPGDEARRLAALGWLELIESRACRVLNPFTPRSLPHMVPGSQLIELPIAEALERAGTGDVEIIIGELAADVHAKGYATTKSAADVAADRAAAAATALAKRKEGALVRAQRYLTNPEMVGPRKELVAGWNTPAGSTLGGWLHEECGITRDDAEAIVGEAIANPTRHVEAETSRVSG